MAMGNGSSAAFAALRPAAQTGHLGVGAGLIDAPEGDAQLQDELLRVEIRLGVEPRPTRLPYVGAVLLTGVRCLFLSVISCRWQNRWTTLTAGR